MNITSPGCAAETSPTASPDRRSIRCETSTPFGWPVVPDVYITANVSSAAGGLSRHVSADWHWRGMHPFHEQHGSQAVAEIFWKPFLTAILEEDDTRANLLRAAFGLPKPGKRAKALSDVIGWDEPSTRQLLSAIAQRVNHLLWRFVETLKYIRPLS